MVTRLTEHLSGTLPGARPNWKELKGVYRLFSNRHMSYGTNMQEHCQQAL
jgi:hypothetical protein